MNKHPFHIVDFSPWPLLGSVGSLCLVSGLVASMHRHGVTLLLVGMVLILVTSIQWWRDVTREATFQGKHTSKVESGMRLGMLLFIGSEIFFFVSFFWAFFHSSLSPNIEVGAVWPPVGILAISPFDVPLLNTCILLSSGATITWAHMALLERSWMETQLSLMVTVVLGIYFTSLQILEYEWAGFTLSDGIYGSTFYVATGFHGLHVFIGTLFIAVMTYRNHCFHFSGVHHFGMEASAWYWHFVDVVWLFLFLSMYWWGS
uniref:Cytochrome c oxidase subunit 3 n=1 Tax=Parasagitta elegans TaxID=1562708 RepID=A0A141CLF5_9BILA|nr:cytochrome c oxidase subunit 3 [Parasagitta elegans]AKS04362.1 cytochrome c oxidase subunit 3 [Parasagitta elegans]AKS04393.1 cytochrome c oxidase subunit 3 [Parasagitta elegans]